MVKNDDMELLRSSSSAARQSVQEIMARSVIICHGLALAATKTTKTCIVLKYTAKGTFENSPCLGEHTGCLWSVEMFVETVYVLRIFMLTNIDFEY